MKSCVPIVFLVLAALGWTTITVGAEKISASASASISFKKTKTDFNYNYSLPAHLSDLKNIESSPQDNLITNAGANLGRVLFYERQLSKNGLVSCGSCHSQEIGFDDPSRFSIGFEGKITKRHSMGLANAAFNATGRFLRDHRMPTLEQQVLDPIFDPIEMGLARGDAEKRISAIPKYKPLFQEAFGADAISEKNIAKALAQFVRSMVSTKSRYDVERPKHKNKLENFEGFSEQENQGKKLFFTTAQSGGAGCFLCHETEAFIMLKRHNNGIDAATLDPTDNLLRGASLKNIAVRSPFMFDGRFKTLMHVIDHYSNGVKANASLSDELKTADQSPLKLNLTAADKDALVAFLKTLTDEAFLKDPKFSNQF